MEFAKTTRNWFVLTSGLLIAGAVGLGFYDFSVIRSAHGSPSLVQQVPLGLHAGRTGNELTLAWDTQSTTLKTAPEAELMIDDGPHKTQLLLTQSQLRKGSMRYSPYTNTVTFHLSALDRSHKSSVETLQVVQSSEPNEAQESNEVSEPASVSQPKSGSAERRTPAVSTASSISGTMIVHGFVARGTPVDVRIPIDSQGKPVEAEAVDTAHKKGGVWHHL